MLTYVNRYDDLIEEENDIVQEALRRLPKEEQYRRAYRIRIAQQCGVTHTELPREQWTKPEDVLTSTSLPAVQAFRFPVRCGTVLTGRIFRILVRLWIK
jgi:hypothetical protein